MFKNGVELFSKAVAGTDPKGFEVYINTTAAVGDVFDFALTPVGLSGDTGDGADGSYMTATILSGTIVPPAAPPGTDPLADSAADWSSPFRRARSRPGFSRCRHAADTHHHAQPEWLRNRLMEQTGRWLGPRRSHFAGLDTVRYILVGSCWSLR